jgi:hypothetical protein
MEGGKWIMVERVVVVAGEGHNRVGTSVADGNLDSRVATVRVVGSQYAPCGYARSLFHAHKELAWRLSDNAACEHIIEELPSSLHLCYSSNRLTDRAPPGCC